MPDLTNAELEALGLSPTNTPPWPDRGGMKQNIQPVLAAAARLASAEHGHAFVIEEFGRNLAELGDRFYSGEVAVVDEFLQLYCLDRQRREGAQPAAPAPPRGPTHIIARDFLQYSTFCHTRGINLKTCRLITRQDDVRGLDRSGRIHRLPGARADDEIERIIAARRIPVIAVSERALLSLEPFEQ